MFYINHRLLLRKQIICIALVAISDILFYKHPIGWTAGLYTGLIFAILIISNRQLLAARQSKLIAFCITTLIIGLIESPSLLAIVMSIFGLMSLIILQKRKKTVSAVLWLNDICRFSEQTGWQWYKDFKSILRIRKNNIRYGVSFRFAVLPLMLTIVFSSLFAEANPIIGRILSLADFEFLNPFVSLFRWLYWLLAAMLLWGLLRPRFPLIDPKIAPDSIDLERWLNPQNLILSLMLFNGLFFIQNSLDVIFLWRNEALPLGLTYAEYAHSGFYPLLFINFLTAAFVLITFNESRKSLQTESAKKMVYLWLGQNLFLTFSAINRLLHYIEAYSLTYLRIAALAGMMLTAAGLFVIFLKIYNKYDNAWLIDANTLVVIITLYSTCFINTDRIIADYNVAHSKEVTGTGSNIDLALLETLGSESLPALHWFKQNARYSPYKTQQARLIITVLEAQLAQDRADWRAWTWRKQSQWNETSAIESPELINHHLPTANNQWQY
ncbi:MAG: DUF4173 domain-containing protein [Methylococcaceae bacterium]|nr:DUF4173 domain-containing protein [Methylococcaceae bacterium]